MRTDTTQLPKHFQPQELNGSRYWPINLVAWEFGIEAHTVRKWILDQLFQASELVLSQDGSKQGRRWLILETAALRVGGLCANGELTRLTHCFVGGREWYSIPHAARMAGVHKRTFWGWAQKGITPFGLPMEIGRFANGGVYVSIETLHALKRVLPDVDRPYRGRPRLKKAADPHEP
jgi:hypothetical protein